MRRKTNPARHWILMLLLSAMGIGLSGCLVEDRDHGHWHDDHDYHEHHDWH